MLGRRSFFRRLAAIVAVVALAPEIAFSRRLEFELPHYVLQSESWTALVENPETCYIIENFSG